MQKVVWTDTIVKGGKKIEGLQMWQPESYKDGKMQSAGSEGGYYQDIAALPSALKENGSCLAQRNRFGCPERGGADD